MVGYVYVPSHHLNKETTTKRRKLSITRGQALFILALIALFSYFLTSFVFASEEGTTSVPVKVITVQEGDSLWEIASAYRADTGLEISDLIDQIMALNEMKDVIIYEGQTLKIPINWKK
ncbi:cell division suppressor protein YneA [Brevibacillus fluminis]|uniref:cell division suppressor protein YneA n=1 Tax=Brevibacillus fluminis TaxID=511487 RepID=UPI003F8CA2B8